MMTSNEIRKQIADKFNLNDPKDVRCYHCKKWGYNRGCVMNSMGESACALRRGMADRKTASYQFCRGFDYVGNGGK
jgi:hypothetical protein